MSKKGNFGSLPLLAKIIIILAVVLLVLWFLYKAGVFAKGVKLFGR